MKALAIAAIYVSQAAASPVAITCNGNGLDPLTGRQAIAGVMTFGFEFDQQAGTMALTRGAPARVELSRVVVTDNMATGTDRKWVYEINRIDGTATVRADLDRDSESRRLGLGGNYFKGTCAVAGAAKF